MQEKLENIFSAESTKNQKPKTASSKLEDCYKILTKKIFPHIILKMLLSYNHVIAWFYEFKQPKL